MWSSEELERLNEHFQNQPPEALLTWATQTFHPRLALTCSFSGPSGMVLLDMVARSELNITVIFLDTDLLFPETYELAALAEQRYGIPIQRRRPALSLEEQDRQEGPHLYARDPDRCCHLRKVTPLTETLRNYDAWISGIRRDQSNTRATVHLLEWNTRHNLVKINPLAFWSDRQVWTYIHTHRVPYNPLLDQGYPSIGCTPCTRPASASNPRAGRWVGFAKTECGLHTG
ncbi:phosphoadenylyl-sulfate reductase [Roseiflexus sp. RS-1]|uniref:phosphoadenylyl-sulfate reductase n=1 Tax=Roseiflexus sp. (strain RS-1) TaxID=357808 RepID=UPI0000D81A10|nr:phosphoadenylyl-sulfate reductase [Roseiflexus sp. RS-1]ABQ89155.1 phosphoadenylylsulfate reductase (thioredoxin) [Roseiflexus sp. RS-1]